MEDIDGGPHPAVDGQSLNEDEDDEGLMQFLVFYVTATASFATTFHKTNETKTKTKQKLRTKISYRVKYGKGKHRHQIKIAKKKKKKKKEEGKKLKQLQECQQSYKHPKL